MTTKPPFYDEFTEEEKQRFDAEMERIRVRLEREFSEPTDLLLSNSIKGPKYFIPERK